MAWFQPLASAVLQFVIGTLVLWVCSLTTKSERATIRTAAIYNAIVTVFGLIVLGTGMLFLSNESGAAGALFLVSTVLTVSISFFLLMRLYDITFVSAIWIVIAMWTLETIIDKVTNAVF